MVENRGLTSKEVVEKLKIYGKNTISVYKVSVFKVFLRQFSSPLIYLLILAAVISFFLSSFADALSITVILLINAFLGFFQEYRSEKFIEKLRSLVKKNTNVRRNGAVSVIPEEEVVPGDIVVLKEGDIVPADGQIVLAEAILVDEATISGESIAIGKNRRDKVFAGTTVTHGYCEFKVTETGSKTELGKIVSLTSKTHKISKYEEGIADLSKLLMKITLIILTLIFLMNILLKGASFANISSFLLFTLALAISIVPEALPVIATLTLSSGALKLAKRHVVVKRLSSVEDLGNIEIFCTDKTGTITKNSLEVRDVVAQDSRKLFSYAYFCLEDGSSLDEAIKRKIPAGILKENQNVKIVETLPFDPALRRRCSLIEKNGKRNMVVFGSAEDIIHLSAGLKTAATLARLKKTESLGLRTLAVAYKVVDKNFSFKEKFDDNKLIFLGYFTIFDPVRETAVSTIDLAQKLKVQIKIITGDSLEVAKFVARKIGLLNKNAKCFSGYELKNFSQDDFDKACLEGVVFARIVPEQKYQIIESLKKQQYVVGYQGDGINDAPALKSANVGIAVNNAADVAREAADVILMDKSLNVIIEGIESGRKIFNNIDKYIKHTMVSNWGNFFSVAVISLFVDFLPLLPIQILLSSVFTDLPLLAVGTDNVDHADLRLPEHYNIFEIVSLPLVLGTIAAVFNLGFFIYFRNLPIAYLRTVWFMLITIRDLFVIISVRKRGWMFTGVRPSIILLSSISIGAVIAFVLPFTSLAGIFHLQGISLAMEALIILITILYLIILDFVKVIFFKKIKLQREASGMNFSLAG